MAPEETPERTPEQTPGQTPAETPEEVRPALRERPAPPPFSSSLPEIEPLPRPRVVLLVGLLVAVAAALYVWSTAVGLLDSGDVRADLAEQLADEAPDFEESDVKKAVNVLFYLANGLGVLFLLGVVYNVNGLLARRVSGRTGFTVMTLLFLPLSGVNFLLRSGDTNDLYRSAAGAVALLLALFIAFLGSVSGWLHQLERTYRIPMDPASRIGQARESQATSD